MNTAFEVACLKEPSAVQDRGGWCIRRKLKAGKVQERIGNQISTVRAPVRRPNRSS